MDALAAACTQPQRSIARKYLANALSSPQRRSIRCANKTFAALTLEAPAALELLQAAGFVHECTDGEGYYTLRPDTANGAGEVDQQIHAAIAALDRCVSPSLLALPDELLLRILHRLPADDLSALQRVSRASGSHASASPLWLKLCPPHFWRMARGGDRFGLETWAAAAPILFASNSSGIVGTTSVGGGGVGGGGGGAPASSARLPRVFIDGIDWQAVSRLVTVWEQLTARSGRDVAVSLRRGLPLDALHSLPGAFRARLPRHVVASLLVHDGQEDDVGSLGLFFASARLLSLEEMRAQDAVEPVEGCLPLSTRVGFQQLLVREADGVVVLASGFNTHDKAPNLAALLERTLVDTM